MQNDHNARVRDYLANERTYLAYIRTAASLIALGISVNRFALYLLEKNVIASSTTTGQTLQSAEQLGVGMAVIGLIVLVWGTVRSAMVFRQIQTQQYRPGFTYEWLLSGIIFAAALAGMTLLLRP